MKKLALTFLTLVSAASLVSAALPGTDNAADTAYSDGWQNGDNGGTLGTFAPWDLTSNNNDGTTNFAGYFIGDSTAGTGDINTSGGSFGIFANPSTAFADAKRDFGSALAVGQTFSITLGVNFRNGNKGFSLESGATEIFNFNVGGDDYQANGSSLGLTYSPTATFDLSFTQTSAGGGTFSIFFNGTNVTPGANTFSGLATGFKLYNSGTDNGDAENNLYFNNLSIVPEPSTWVMVAGGLGMLTLLRRRRA